jgi:hypothetical protein
MAVVKSTVDATAYLSNAQRVLQPQNHFIRHTGIQEVPRRIPPEIVRV